MANVGDINIGDLETGLERARAQTALLKALGRKQADGLTAAQTIDRIAGDLELLAQRLRAETDRAAMAAAGLDAG